MPQWKRLTLANSSTEKVDVNLENVAYIRRMNSAGGEYTQIVFTAAKTDSLVIMAVKETPDEIHKTNLLKTT